MKKKILTLCTIMLATTCAFAGPHDMKPHKGTHRNPPKMQMHHPRPIHNHHHRHTWGYSYYNYHPCTCYDPYCIHRHHLNSYFRLGPNLSIGISI